LTLTLHYRFVHLLYQNALYQSLTAGRKASLSTSVGHAIESYFGEDAANVASELALLYEVGRDFSRSSDFFVLAARNAARMFANQEAIELARRGLALLEKLPDTPERAQKELTLHITLGVPLMTIKGYGASEVEQSYTRARELSQRLGESPRVFLVVAGLWAYYMIRAELKTARELAEQCMRLAQKVPTFLVQAHWMLENTLLHLGELVLAREYSEKGIAFYDPKHHRSYTSRYGHDLNVARLSHSARILWLLGYPDQALKRVEEAMSFAEKLSHRPSKAFALFLASYIHECRGEWAMTQRRAEAAINISRELELANWPTWSSIMLGRALAEQGHTSEGVALILESLDALRSMGSEISRPHFLALLAESLSKEGRAEEALAALDEALVASDNSDERYYEAELHRLRGDLKLMQFAQIEPLRSANDMAARAETDESLMVEAEASFRQAILIARQQGAKSLELRAVISLSRMLRQQGKLTEAREMLAEVHGWFTEGFDTADLKAAKMLLDEMGAGTVLSSPSTFLGNESGLVTMAIAATDIIFHISLDIYQLVM
jgi:predicted ATPase